MGLISGMMLGMIVGIAVMAGWHRMMQHRSKKRTSKVLHLLDFLWFFRFLVLEIN